jgi:hypothetical protein
MSQDSQRLADGRKFIVTRKRDKNFVTNAANIDDRLRRQRARELAIEKRNHVSESLTDRAETANCSGGSAAPPDDVINSGFAA